MKKLTLIIASLIVCLLVACGSSPKDKKSEKSSDKITVQSPQKPIKRISAREKNNNSDSQRFSPFVNDIVAAFEEAMALLRQSTTAEEFLENERKSLEILMASYSTVEELEDQECTQAESDKIDEMFAQYTALSDELSAELMPDFDPTKDYSQEVRDNNNEDNKQYSLKDL